MMIEDFADFGILLHRWHQDVDMAGMIAVSPKARHVYLRSNRMSTCVKLGCSSLWNPVIVLLERGFAEDFAQAETTATTVIANVQHISTRRIRRMRFNQRAVLGVCSSISGHHKECCKNTEAFRPG